MPTCPALHREAPSFKQQPEQPPVKHPSVPLGCFCPALQPLLAAAQLQAAAPRSSLPAKHSLTMATAVPGLNSVLAHSAPQLHLLPLLPAATSGCTLPDGAGRTGVCSPLLHEPQVQLRNVQEPRAGLAVQAEVHKHGVHHGCGGKPEQQRVLQTRMKVHRQQCVGCPWHGWLWLPALKPSVTFSIARYGSTPSWCRRLAACKQRLTAPRSCPRSLHSGQPLYLRFPGKQFLFITEKRPALRGEGGAWPPLHAKGPLLVLIFLIRVELIHPPL